MVFVVSQILQYLWYLIPTRFSAWSEAFSVVKRDVTNHGSTHRRWFYDFVNWEAEDTRLWGLERGTEKMAFSLEIIHSDEFSRVLLAGHIIWKLFRNLVFDIHFRFQLQNCAETSRNARASSFVSLRDFVILACY